MKWHSAPSRPMHSIEKSVDVQIQQASIAMATNEASTQLMIDKQILWSDLPTKDHLCKRGESLVTEQWNLSSNYDVRRSGEMEWKTAYKDGLMKEPEGPIPVFRRVRTITVKAGKAHCTCCLFERQGYGCRHILSVIRSEVPGYLGFQVEDISVHWWTIYYHFGEKPKLNQELTSQLRQLHKEDIKGPALPNYEEVVGRWDASTIEGGLEAKFREKSPHETVANYSPQAVTSVVKRFNPTTSIGRNMSQISVNYSSDDGNYNDYDLTGDSNDNDYDLTGNSNGYDLTQDSTDDEHPIEFPSAAAAPTSWKETSAFQAVGPVMKEYLDILELASEKESKIKSLVTLMSNLIIDEKKEQLKLLGVNNEGRKHVSCLVGHDKRRRVQVTLKGNQKKAKMTNPYKKK